MKTLIPMNEHGLFADKTDTARLDSRFVANAFRKDHKKVLRDIRELDCSGDFHRANFGPIFYKDDYSRRQPAYTMTRDGFTFLVMGYRGKKAAQFKEAYIQRFNEMEALIAEVVAARMECPELTANIQALHENPKPYHYSNEFDMINRIALGMTAKKFRELHGIPTGQSIRPYLTEKQISDIVRLQHADTGLTLAVPDFQERKRILTDFKTNRLDVQQTNQEAAACIRQ